MAWYKETSNKVLKEFGVAKESGLTKSQAEENLKTYGRNVLAARKKETIPSIFIRQFKSPLIYILILAAALVFSLGQITDGWVILSIVIFNAFIGTFQEGRARNSLEKLKDLTKHKALVLRNGEDILLLSEEVVPGDIIVLREGDRVCADARIIIAESLKLDEAILTGEAYPIAKSDEIIEKNDIPIGDQKNMLFSGTSVVSGYAKAVVVATGINSELGKISKGLLETGSIPLPLVKKITRLTHFIAASVFGIAFFIFILGLVKGIALKEIFAAVVGLSVSLIPEGLPVVVTIVLAKGVWRMAKAKAVVRQMAAVEAMGSADVLMVDKTGTITTGEMLIKELYMEDGLFHIGGSGYTPLGTIIGGAPESKEKLNKILSLTYLSLKADIVLDDGIWKPLGDPTEAAVAALCRKAGFSKAQLEEKYKTVVSKPFDSKKRYLEAQFKDKDQTWSVFVGAPEFLSQDLKIDHNLKGKYLNLTNDGLRVVGVAVYGPSKSQLYGYALLAIEEELRPNVAQSIKEAKSAGLKVAMLTGDFPKTALAIATEVGIYDPSDKFLTGKDIDGMSVEELEKQVEGVTVFARITPTHKLKIVNAFKRRGHIVAMTGDGVNDGPALQAANLGIGLGSGTQVAQDASDIVLMDSNFETIVRAIAEGRGIYLTLKKVILYLLSTSFGEALTIAGTILIGLPLPLVAAQIIWLNFVTDGFLDISLAQDPPEKKLMNLKYRDQGLVDKLMKERIVIMGISMFVATLPVFYIVAKSSTLGEARSVALLILSITQWYNALNVRSQDVSIFKTSILNNRFLIFALIIVFFLQFFAIQTQMGNKLLHTTPLTITHWLLAGVASLAIVFAEETRKYFARVTDRGLSPNS